MSLLPDSLQNVEGWMKKCSRLLAIPKLNRVEKDDTFRPALKSEPVLSVGLGIYDGDLFMLVGFPLAVNHDPNLAQLVFDHQIDPFV